MFVLPIRAVRHTHSFYPRVQRAASVLLDERELQTLVTGRPDRYAYCCNHAGLRVTFP